MLRPFDSRHSFDRREEIKEVIELPIKHPEIFESLGISQPKAWKSPCYALRFVQLAAGLPGRAVVWPPWHWQDAARASCRPSYQLLPHS